MSKTARLHDKAIVEFLIVPDGMELTDCYHADFLAQCATVPDAAEVGWTLGADGRAWEAPPTPPPAARTAPGAVLVHVLDKATKVTPRDLAYVAGLNAAREDMASIIRIAGVDGRTASAWFDTALIVTG